MAAEPGRPPLVLATAAGGARGALPAAAAVAVAAAGLADRDRPTPVVLAELDATGARSPTVLASAAARDLERALRAGGFAAAARGALCWLALPDAAAGLDELERALEAVPAGALIVAVVPPRLWTAALERSRLAIVGGLVRCDVSANRPLAALAATELRERGFVARIEPRGLGPLVTRRALAGLDPGGAAARRARRIAAAFTRADSTTMRVPRLALVRRIASEAGQSLPLILAATFAILVVAGVLAALGGAVTGAEGVQRGADLAALSAVRSMRDDLPRALAPALLPSGAPNPRHLGRIAYLDRAAAAARQAAARNGLDPARVRVSFPDRTSPIPLRSRVAVRARLRGHHVELEARAEAEATLPASYDPTPTYASGGGYSGPLAYRQGKGMRPDVATAFDRLSAAAAGDGVQLIINSAYRSDAEQARLYAQNPDPRMVAPPGTSLHRCATELDLGPPSAYAWLEANAPWFGFLQRYPWERWHWGYTRGPAPCSAAGNSVGTAGSAPDGEAADSALPGFVPEQYRAPVLRSAARWQVPAALLAAQLEAESGFDPRAVSPAGAEGIAQFMPGTAASYGLRDPFDPVAAIDAEAHMMSDLLREFGSVSLALAAYNAGSGAVAACHCVPPIPETQAYVARILALMGAAGEIAAPELEVRLVD